ncbi:MAG TPA: tripartite tricarboxylate transporter substrate binding protein [Xanthobacteraceae bacterium]|jgi:tripartite-type tricarboxylate transporter receptor subunit TctC|nr:tripartite tricarboxylate transporter substrate binding protein [Xanthobacteraceae bacterium]
MKAIGALIAMCLLAFAADPASSQAVFPERTVRILVGYVPGGPNDIIARAIGDKLAQLWGRSVIVENVPGASGNIAGDRVAKAAPDGYTLLLANSAQVVVNPSLFENMNYDPLKELAPVSEVAFTPNLLTVPNDLPVHNVQELVALVRATPGKYSFGSAGVGTTQHLAGELFKWRAKLDLQHIPYRGASAVITDLLGSRITMFFGNIAPLLPLVREGKLRALAVTSRDRFAAVPEIPTVAESGFPGFEVIASFGLMVAARTPPGVIDKISRDTAQVLAQDDLRQRFADIGVVVIGNSPAQFSAALKAEAAQWANLIKETGIRASQ